MTNPLAGVNGPRAGRGSGRQRNTLVNNASKATTPTGPTTTSYQAPLSSSSQVQYGSQLAQARYDYLSQLAALKAQRAQVGAQFGVAAQDARSAAIGNMAAAEGGAQDRGLLGSSLDLSGRAGVIADRQRAIADAQSQRAAGRLDLAQQGIGVRSGYYTQVAGIQNAIAQEQMYNGIQAFQNDTFDAMQQNYQDILQAILDRKRGRTPIQRNGLGGVAGASAAHVDNPNHGDPFAGASGHIGIGGGVGAHNPLTHQQQNALAATVQGIAAGLHY